MSRFGEVPVLVVDGTPIVQSNAILLHLMRATGRLEGSAGTDRVIEWLCWEANRIGFSLPNLRVVRRFQDNAAPDVVAWLERRLESDLDRLDQEFESGARFLPETACRSPIFRAAAIFSGPPRRASIWRDGPMSRAGSIVFAASRAGQNLTFCSAHESPRGCRPGFRPAAFA
jgi:glutathione S-transferase